MKISIIVVYIALLAGSARAASDIFFLPAAAGATVSFEGVTQAGRDTHRFEVRRLAYVDSVRKEETPTTRVCVIYYAGDEYGPHILKEMQAIDPFVRRVGHDIVEVYFYAGAHAHIRQTWRLLSGTAQLEKEEDIAEEEDPRPIKKP